MQLKELMVLVPTLVTRINSLEKELKDTKQTLGNAALKLVKKVKSLKTTLKRKSKKGKYKKTRNHPYNLGRQTKNLCQRLLLKVLARKNQLIRARDVGGEQGSVAKNINIGLDAEKEHSRVEQKICGKDLPEQDFAKEGQNYVNQEQQHLQKKVAKGTREMIRWKLTLKTYILYE
ncbi:hypothetical protein Tco_1502450 [Tanacetum coccineum]